MDGVKYKDITFPVGFPNKVVSIDLCDQQGGTPLEQMSPQYVAPLVIASDYTTKTSMRAVSSISLALFNGKLLDYSPSRGESLSYRV